MLLKRTIVCSCSLQATKLCRCHVWAQWLGDHLWEKMGEFLHSVDPMIEDVWEGGDDCTVRDAMGTERERGIPLSSNELRAAFATANTFYDIPQEQNRPKDADAQSEV